MKTWIISCGVAGLCIAFDLEWCFNSDGINIAQILWMYFFRGLKYGEMWLMSVSQSGLSCDYISSVWEYQSCLCSESRTILSCLKDSCSSCHFCRGEGPLSHQRDHWGSADKEQDIKDRFQIMGNMVGWVMDKQFNCNKRRGALHGF